MRANTHIEKNRYGKNSHEKANHLGNVLAVISDQWKTECTTTSTVVGGVTITVTTFDRYKATLVQATDYHPFGAPLPWRSWSEPALSDKYRFGFNGKENDNEVMGTGNFQDYGMRMYDTRLGRFISVDPLTYTFPYYTPYQFAGNMPIIAMDLDGLEPKYMITEKGRLTKPMMSLMNAAFDYKINRMEKTK